MQTIGSTPQKVEYSRRRNTYRGVHNIFIKRRRFRSNGPGGITRSLSRSSSRHLGRPCCAGLEQRMPGRAAWK